MRRQVDHHVDKLVERLLALGLGGLDHHRLRHDQWEVDRRRVKPTVDQRLGDVHRANALALTGLPRRGKDHLMLADARIGQVIMRLKFLADVVGIEHRVLAHAGQSLAAQQQNVRIRPQHNRKIAIIRRDVADRLRRVVIEIIRAIVMHTHHRNRQKFLESRNHANRPRARPTAAMGRGERFVQIEMADVKAHIAGFALAHHGIEVRAVVVHQAIDAVDQLSDLVDPRVENPQGVRAREHQPGDLLANLVKHRTQRLDAHHALLIGGNRADIVAGNRRGRGIRAVGTIGNQNRGFVVAHAAMIRRHQHHTGQLAMGPRKRLHGKSVHPGNLAEKVVHIMQHLQRPLHELLAGGQLRQQGVKMRKARQAGDLLRDFRVVFHRARAQRIKARLDAKVFARERIKVSADVQLAHFRQCRRGFSHEFGVDIASHGHVLLDHARATSASNGFFEDQFHSDTSSVCANRSISRLVRFSVTAKSKQLSMPG